MYKVGLGHSAALNKINCYDVHLHGKKTELSNPFALYGLWLSQRLTKCKMSLKRLHTYVDWN